MDEFARTHLTPSTITFSGSSPVPYAVPFCLPLPPMPIALAILAAAATSPASFPDVSFEEPGVAVAALPGPHPDPAAEVGAVHALPARFGIDATLPSALLDSSHAR